MMCPPWPMDPPGAPTVPPRTPPHRHLLPLLTALHFLLLLPSPWPFPFLASFLRLSSLGLFFDSFSQFSSFLFLFFFFFYFFLLFSLSLLILLLLVSSSFPLLLLFLLFSLFSSLFLLFLLFFSIFFPSSFPSFSSLLFLLPSFFSSCFPIPPLSFFLSFLFPFSPLFSSPLPVFSPSFLCAGRCPSPRASRATAGAAPGAGGACPCPPSYLLEPALLSPILGGKKQQGGG